MKNCRKLFVFQLLLNLKYCNKNPLYFVTPNKVFCNCNNNPQYLYFQKPKNGCHKIEKYCKGSQVNGRSFHYGLTVVQSGWADVFVLVYSGYQRFFLACDEELRRPQAATRLRPSAEDTSGVVLVWSYKQNLECWQATPKITRVLKARDFLMTFSRQPLSLSCEQFATPQNIYLLKINKELSVLSTYAVVLTLSGPSESLITGEDS